MYIKVKLTEERECLVNPNCSVRILLDYICSLILTDESPEHKIEKLDMCDESYVLKHLSDLPNWTNCVEEGILVPRNTYYVITFECENGHITKPHIPLSRGSKHFTEMMAKIRRQILSTKPKSGKAASRKGAAN